MKSGSPTNTYTRIHLENCTAEHFKYIPAIRDSIQTGGIDKWYCFPLNRTFEIGGNYLYSNNSNSFYLKVKCDSSCHPNTCGTISIYQTNSIINPQNHAHPFEHFLNENFVDLSHTKYQQYMIQMD